IGYPAGPLVIRGKIGQPGGEALGRANVVDPGKIENNISDIAANAKRLSRCRVYLRWRLWHYRDRIAKSKRPYKIDDAGTTSKGVRLRDTECPERDESGDEAAQEYTRKHRPALAGWQGNIPGRQHVDQPAQYQHAK